MLYKGYSALSTLCSPAAAGVLLCSRRGRQRYCERFGGWQPVGDVDWWFHGASLGEVQGLLPIRERLKSQLPTERTLLTATSPTGLERGSAAFEELRLLPLDVGWCVHRALNRVSAKRFVMCETELWPTLLRQLAARRLPMHIVNARLSDYTLKWYQRMNSIFAPIVAEFRSICVANVEQRDRYLSLGAQPGRVFVTGHSKYDVVPRFSASDVRQELRRSFFSDASLGAPIVTLGSVRPGEEQLWFAAFKALKQSGSLIRMVVVPRHSEKFEYFAQQISSLGLSFARWSNPEQIANGGHEILLMDTIGKLEEAYAVADLAFVGATLVDIGGHNPMEPAMYQVPVAVGPHTSVIRDVVTEMRRVGGLIEVANDSDIAALLERVSRRDPLLRQSGELGCGVWEQHRGAAERIVAVLRHE